MRQMTLMSLFTLSCRVVRRLEGTVMMAGVNVGVKVNAIPMQLRARRAPRRGDWVKGGECESERSNGHGKGWPDPYTGQCVKDKAAATGGEDVEGTPIQYDYVAPLRPAQNCWPAPRFCSRGAGGFGVTLGACVAMGPTVPSWFSGRGCKMVASAGAVRLCRGLCVSGLRMGRTWACHGRPCHW